MTVRSAVWLDHEKAIIAMIEPGVERLAVVASRISELFRTPVGARSSHPWGRRNKSRTDIEVREHDDMVTRFFGEVIARLSGSEAIMVCGPGAAKLALIKRMHKSGMDARVKAIEPADKMTDRQFLAKARAFFHAAKSRDHAVRGLTHNVPVVTVPYA